MDNIFKISLHDFKIRTIIGILPSERIKKQNIIIDLDILYNKNEVLDYSNLYNLITEIFNKNHFLYLEDAICFVLDSIKSEFKDILNITICIKKPDILKNCVASVSKTLNLVRS